MQEFHPVASTKLYIQIYNQLYAAIASGRFQVVETPLSGGNGGVLTV